TTFCYVSTTTEVQRHGEKERYDLLGVSVSLWFTTFSVSPCLCGLSSRSIIRLYLYNHRGAETRRRRKVRFSRCLSVSVVYDLLRVSVPLWFIVTQHPLRPQSSPHPILTSATSGR